MAAEDMTFSITKGHRQVQGSSNDHSIMPSCLLHAQGQPSPLLAYGIISLGLQQFSDSDNGKDLPTVAWDPVWGELPHFLHQKGFAVVTGITSCYVAGNIVGDAQPPVVAGD